MANIAQHHQQGLLKEALVQRISARENVSNSQRYQRIPIENQVLLISYLVVELDAFSAASITGNVPYVSNLVMIVLLNPN